jgi:hypothetical protein
LWSSIFSILYSMLGLISSILVIGAGSAPSSTSSRKDI